MSNVARLAGNHMGFYLLLLGFLGFFFFGGGVFSPPLPTESEGQVGVEQGLQSRAHKASGHDPLACIKDAACD